MYFSRVLKNIFFYWTSKIGIFILFIICWTTFNTSSSANIQILNDFSLSYNNISGPGKGPSFLKDGYRYLNILDITGDGVSGDLDYFINIGARFTDDRNIDPQTFLLTNFKAGKREKYNSINLGDIYREFSQYSLSTSLKGWSYSFRNEDAGLPEVDLIYGYVNSRWDNFHGFGESNIESIKSKVVGAKVNYNFSHDVKAGLSIVSTDDSERVSDSDELYDIISYTIGWKGTLTPNITITGESSLADTSLSISSDAEEAEIMGYAHNLILTEASGPGKFTIQYKKVSPDYRTLFGSATSDREKVRVKWKYNYNNKHSITSGFFWYRNNLDNVMDTRTDHYLPEISLMTHRPLGRENATADISYRVDITKQNKAFTSRIDQIVNLNYKDRFGIFDSISNLGISSYEYKVDQKQRNREYAYNTSINAKLYYDDFTLKPALRLGGWISRQALTSLSDKIYEYSLGADLDIPSVRITSNIQLGQNRLEKGSGTDSMKSFARINVFYKPDFLSKPRNNMIFLKAYINDYNYDNTASSFRETSITSGINIKF